MPKSVLPMEALNLENGRLRILSRENWLNLGLQWNLDSDNYMLTFGELIKFSQTLSPYKEKFVKVDFNDISLSRIDDDETRLGQPFA